MLGEDDNIERLVPIVEMDAIIRMAEYLELAANELSPPATDVAAALSAAIARARAYQDRSAADAAALRRRLRHS